MECYFTAFDVFAELLKGNYVNNLEICDSSRYIPGSFGSFKWRTDLNGMTQKVMFTIKILAKYGRL